MKRGAAFALLLNLASGYAHAEEGKWVTEIQNDPFAKAQRIRIGYLSPGEVGVFLFCYQDVGGFNLTVVPGYPHESWMDRRPALMELAVDGRHVWEEKAKVGKFDNGLVYSEIDFTPLTGRWLVDAFIQAREQIAILDGIGERGHLLNVDGARKAGEAISRCMNKEAVPDN